MPLELVAGANACQLVLVSAEEDEAAKFPAVRLQEDRLEAFDLALLLQAGVVLENLAETLDRLLFAGPPRGPPTHEKPQIPPVSLLWPKRGLLCTPPFEPPGKRRDTPPEP